MRSLMLYCCEFLVFFATFYGHIKIFRPNYTHIKMVYHWWLTQIRPLFNSFKKISQKIRVTIFWFFKKADTRGRVVAWGRYTVNGYCRKKKGQIFYILVILKTFFRFQKEHISGKKRTYGHPLSFLLLTYSWKPFKASMLSMCIKNQNKAKNHPSIYPLD